MSYMGSCRNPKTRGRGAKQHAKSGHAKRPKIPRVNPRKRWKSVLQKRPKKSIICETPKKEFRSSSDHPV